MLKFEQRKQKMIARAISASFLVQTCAFPAVHAFAADEVAATPVSNKSKDTSTSSGASTASTAQTGAEEKTKKVATINLKESTTNSFKDKSDSELWAALGITRDEYDKVSMSEFKNYIEKRHANDETYQNSRKEQKDSYDLVMTEAETEMLNRKNNSFNWKAENAASKINGFFVEKKSEGSTTTSPFKTGGSAVKHAFENWDTLSDTQKEVVAMTAVQMGYKGKTTSDNDKFKAVENLQKVISSYSKDHTAANVYEAVTDFMKSNGIDFDKVLKEADSSQQQVNQTSDNDKVTNGVEEKKKPCPTGYKHDEVNNICCAEDSTYDKFEGKCKKEIKAENVCNPGFTLDTYANKCCPTGSSYDAGKGACVIPGEVEKPKGSGGKNQQLLGVLAGLFMNKKGGGKNADSKNSDSRGGAIATQDDKGGMSKERAEQFVTVPFDFRFSYGEDTPESQRYFGDVDKDNNVVVAGTESTERINITIKDRGEINNIEKNIKKQVESYNQRAKKDGKPVFTDYPRVHISLRVFNPEAIEKGVVDDSDRKWFAPYSLLKEVQSSTNGMAQYEIEQGKPEVVIPKGFFRPAGDYFAYVIYHIPHFNQVSGLVTYKDTAFRVGYTVYKANTSLASSNFSKGADEARGVAQVEKNFGQVEASGVIESALWNDQTGTCDVSLSGTFSDSNQTTEGKNVSVRSKSISREECASSVGKRASFGKLTLPSVYSENGGDGNRLVDYDYDEENKPKSLGGAVTIGERVVQDGDYTLSDEYASTVNRGKRITSTRVKVENLDYLDVAGFPLAYNSASKEFYNYDGTPLSSSQKKDISAKLGTKYWDEWNHIGADVTVDEDGVHLTREDGSVLSGTRITEQSKIAELQKSAEGIRGSVMSELVDDRGITANHYTKADKVINQRAGDYSHLFSNPQSKLQSDSIGVASSTLGLGDDLSSYLRYGLNNAIDISGSAGAKTSRQEEKERRKQEKEARRAQREAERQERREKREAAKAGQQSNRTSETQTSSLVYSNKEVLPSIQDVGRFGVDSHGLVGVNVPESNQISKPVADTPKETVLTPYNPHNMSEEAYRGMMAKGTDIHGNPLENGIGSAEQAKEFQDGVDAYHEAQRKRHEDIKNGTFNRP